MENTSVNSSDEAQAEALRLVQQAAQILSGFSSPTKNGSLDPSPRPISQLTRPLLAENVTVAGQGLVQAEVGVNPAPVLTLRSSYLSREPVINHPRAGGLISVRRESTTATSPRPVAPLVPPTTRFGIAAATNAQTVVSEMRNAFSPYPTTGTHRSSGSRNTSLTRQRPHAVAIHSKQFYCLGSPADVVTPTGERKAILQAAGLGQSMIRFDRSGGSELLERTLRNEFPKLENHQFELLRPLSIGQGKELIRISRSFPIPAPDMLIESRVAMVYIRPLVCIATEDPMEEDLNELAANAVQESQASPSTSTSAGFPFTPEQIPTSSRVTRRFAEQWEDFLSLNEYREDMFQNNEGYQYIVISRDSFMEELFGVYKDPNFEFKKKTFVKFLGESGRDINALSREFFTLAMNKLKTAKIGGSHVMFEGEDDHILPSNDSMLVRSGHFKFLGKFFAHAAVHVGTSFVGFSQAAVRYIFTNREDADERIIELSVSDIPNMEARIIAQKMSSWIDDGVCPGSEVVQSISDALNEANIYEQPCRGNLHLILQQFMDFHVIQSRAAALSDIREGVKATEFYSFLSKREYLWETIFPKVGCFLYSPDDLINIIRYSGETQPMIQTNLEKILRGLDSLKLKQLLQCWTGWEGIPLDGLEVKVVETGEFKIHACFNQIEVPMSIPEADLKLKIMLAIEYGTLGFGSV